MLALAVALVGDGEGSTRTVRLTVSGAWDDDEAAAVARSVGDSPLVKAAFFGGDPNWGRIVQAAGQVVGRERRRAVSRRGRLRRHRGRARRRAGRSSARPTRRASAALMAEPEIDLRLTLHRGPGAATSTSAT